MKRTARYNVSVRALCGNLHLASLTIVAQPDEEARLQLSNALYLVGEAIRYHEADVMRMAASGALRVEVNIDAYRVS